ncbi:putative carboxylesterase [Helianthus debilis subsp. tardiflorus]
MTATGMHKRTEEETESRQEILKREYFLNQYWKDTVKEKDRMPQKEGAKLRKCWLYGGTNYRRIVEPLDIAEHYKNGKTNYLNDRSDDYKLLEKWSDEDKRDSKSSEVKRNKAASLTEDSCFWAHVEEALISR